jgi:hypothetical protein
VYTISSEDGPANPSILVNVEKGGSQFVAHSHEMYEVHILPFIKEERGQTVRLAKIILQMMFRDLEKLQKVIALIPAFKIHAIKIAQQCGYRYEGSIVNAHYHLGIMEDIEIYGINREEVNLTEEL